MLYETFLTTLGAVTLVMTVVCAAWEKQVFLRMLMLLCGCGVLYLVYRIMEGSFLHA